MTTQRGGSLPFIVMRKSLFLLLCFTFVKPLIHSAESAKAPVIITAPARLENRDGWTYLIISNSNHSYELPWARPPHFDGDVALQADQVYTFTVIEEPFMRDVLIPHVAKVEQNGRTIYDREVCEVHHAKMERKKVRVVYGLIRPGAGEPSSDTERRLFPHRHEISFGGCDVGSYSPKTEKIYVCDQCKKAYAKWKAENPSPR